MLSQPLPAVPIDARRSIRHQDIPPEFSLLPDVRRPRRKRTPAPLNTSEQPVDPSPPPSPTPAPSPRPSTAMSGSVAATITQKDPSKRPILEGDAWTLEILADFERRAADYVDEEIDLSKTPAVPLIVRGIKSADFRNWYDLGEDQYASMPLADFMQLVRGVFLPTDWDLKMKEKIYASSQGSRCFMEFVLETTRLNQILPKASRIPNDTLRDILQSRLSAKLLRLVHRTTIALTPDSTATFKQAVVDDKGGETFQDVTRSVDKSRMRLTEWVTKVHKLDEQVREDEEEMRTQMAIMLRLERARVAK